MFGRRTHYHISTISGRINVSPVVKQDEVEAMLEWDKMVNFVRDQIGMDADSSGHGEAKFLDGTIVRMKKCHGNCLG